MASKMYVDQLKDVLVHSTSKKVAGFIAEPIQVRTVCAQTNKKLFDIIELEARWPHGWYALPRMEHSWFELWLGTLCCVLAQDTLLTKCLSPPRSINGYRQIVEGNPADRQTDRQTHRQTDRQTHRQTDRQTHRQTDRQTHRQTDRHTDRQTDRHTHRQTRTQTDRQTGR